MTAAHHLNIRPFLYIKMHGLEERCNFRLDQHASHHRRRAQVHKGMQGWHRGTWVSHHPSVCHRLSPSFSQRCCWSVNKREKHQASWGVLCADSWGRASLSQWITHWQRTALTKAEFWNTARCEWIMLLKNTAYRQLAMSEAWKQSMAWWHVLIREEHQLGETDNRTFPLQRLEKSSLIVLLD